VAKCLVRETSNRDVAPFAHYAALFREAALASIRVPSGAIPRGVKVLPDAVPATGRALRNCT